MYFLRSIAGANVRPISAVDIAPANVIINRPLFSKKFIRDSEHSDRIPALVFVMIFDKFFNRHILFYKSTIFFSLTSLIPSIFSKTTVKLSTII